MDDLLMAVKAAGASAAPATLVFSRPDEARFFCCVFPGIVIAAAAEHMKPLKGIEN
jgi:hypothetical protein